MSDQLIINIRQQQLSVYRDGKLLRQYPVSTSKFGTGNQRGSFCTPLGKHSVAEKIGEGAACNQVFIGRQPQGVLDDLRRAQVVLPEDLITSRILWLAGLEPGCNQGGEIDSHDRYIYIHGTPEEHLIGTPVSHGCIRMCNADVIELFDLIEVGCEVDIIEPWEIAMNEFEEYELETLAVRAGQVRTHENEHSEPIFLTSSFVFGSAAEAAARFAGTEPGNIYSRFTNPTVRVFEERLAAMEGAESCVATASGMAAILATCMGLLKAGDHIVSSRSIFGTTTVMFNNYLAKFGIETSFVDLVDVAAWRAAIKPNSKLFFLETPSNPLTEIADIRALSDLAHQHGCLLAVDNCFCTPVLQRPLELGADIVIHSATKYLDGQGRCMGGAVLGKKDKVGTDVYGFLRTCGPTLSAFNAWVFLKGLETLPLRMKAHCENALLLARWLEQQPAVAKVYYPGLENHPQHALAKKQQSGFGGIVSFELKGGKDAGWKLIDATRMVSITANLGDTKTTITHPATTTHGRLTPEQRTAAGIADGLIRISVGIEAIEDIKKDLARGM